MAEVFSNNSSTNLNGALNNSATTVTVNSTAAPFPQTGNFRVRVDNEIMIVTAVPSGTTWTVTRGAEGTAAASHSSGAEIWHIISAGGLAALKTDVVNLIVGSGAISVSSGTVSIAAASGSVPGTMSAADFTKLSGIATSAEVNYINSLGTMTGGITASVGSRALAIGINLATSVAQGAMSAADKATLDARTATAGASTIAVRDGSGNLVAASFIANNNDNLASQPPNLVGRASDGTYKTYQNASITVGSATNATNATSAGTANALASGTTDGDKLHGITVGAASSGGNFTGAYRLDGSREWYLAGGIGTPPADTRVILGPYTLPTGISSSGGILSLTCGVIGDSSAAMHRINIQARFASSTTIEVIIGCPDGSNLNNHITSGLMYVHLWTA